MVLEFWQVNKEKTFANLSIVNTSTFSLSFDKLIIEGMIGPLRHSHSSDEYKRNHFLNGGWFKTTHLPL